MSCPGSGAESDHDDNNVTTRADHHVWSHVNVTIHCHSRGFRQLVTIQDPVSRWIVAENLPLGCDNIPHFIASFMFRTFCSFGFPKVDLFNINSIQYELIVSEYQQMIAMASQVIPELSLLQSECSLNLKSVSEDNSSILSQDMSGFLFNPSAVNTNIWLLSQRLRRNEAGVSPFSKMFSRKLVGRTVESGKLTRRPLQSSVLHCRHCDESFTSKISFRIHQRRHTEEARLRGQREGEAPLAKVEEEEEDGHDGDEKDSEENPELEKNGQLKRRRVRLGRNKQLKRRRLARLAETWAGDQESTRGNDDRTAVSEHAAEAVRAMLRATREERAKRGKYLRYSPDLRDEIAEYALVHGHTAAAQHYSDKLNTLVAESSVRNFVRDLQTFPRHIRLEIGQQASEHGLEVSTKVWSAKLGQDVTRNMVTRFRKQYLDTPYNVGPGSEDVSGGVSADPKTGPLYSQELREEIGQYAGSHGVDAAVRVYSDKLLFPVKLSTVRKFRQLYGSTPHHDRLAAIQLSETSSTTIDLLHSSLDVLNQHHGAAGGGYYQQQPGCSSFNESITKQQKPVSGKGKVKKEPKKAARGRYVQYSDELRARIGKFALAHGNTAAIKHFYAELGHEIPESTIRGMKDKYQLVSEKKGGGVAAVGCGPRGRPTFLGPELDSMVQEAVRKLGDKGEKITSFLVIAAAKQVIMHKEPGMLEEAAAKLNTTWAKSLMRRVGVKKIDTS